MKKITIAIDGYSSCGKSTLAKALAAKLDYIFVDSGAMYRAFTLYCLRNNLVEGNTDVEKINKALKEVEISFKHNSVLDASETYLNGESVEKEIRELQVSDNVSKISAIKEVRIKMVSLQQQMGKNKGVVMDGRDIGTVVFPDAELKLFMTADKEIRAKRRYDEMTAKGSKVSFEVVKENVQNRDYKDTHREESPLIQAHDAIVLDNTNMSQQEQLEFALKLVGS